MLSGDQWKTPPLSKLSGSSSRDNSHIFAVFDRDQKIVIEVHDDAYIGASELLGRAKTMSVLDILEESKESQAPTTIQLYGPQAKKKGSKEFPTCAATLSFHKFVLVPSSVGSQGVLFTIKIDRIIMPVILGKKAGFSVKIGQKPAVTTPIREWIEPTDAVLVANATKLDGVIQRCLDRGMSKSDVAHLTGYTMAQLEEAINKQGERKVRGKERTPRTYEVFVEWRLFIPVTLEELHNEEIVYAIMNGQKPLTTRVEALDSLRHRVLSKTKAEREMVFNVSDSRIRVVMQIFADGMFESE